jgi:FkbM family methyltransferase
VIRPIELIWNATATHHGRLNFLYRWRRWGLRTFTPFGSGHPAIYSLSGGRKFVVHPGDNLSIQIALAKAYEPLESKIVERILRNGEVAIDIGANIGYYTSLCSRGVGESGKVLAFEPGEITFGKLQATIALLGLSNVESHRRAVADKPGTVSFVMSASGSDAQQSLVDWELLAGDKAARNVEAVTLDQIVDGLKPQKRVPAFVKCDVEGGEGKVLDGGRRLLESDSPPVLLLEFNRTALELQQTSVRDLLDKLQGYRLYFTPLDGHEPRMQTLASAGEIPELVNVIAFPKRGAYADRIREVVDYLPVDAVVRANSG